MSLSDYDFPVDDDFDDWGDFGECPGCGEIRYWDVCLLCAGDGQGDDGPCSECGGVGDVLFCECYLEALDNELEDRANQ